MKKLVLLGVVVAVFAAAGLFVFRSTSAQEIAAAETLNVSKQTAQVLQKKIDHIKKTEESGAPSHPDNEIWVTEAELESYVLFELRSQIPLQMDSFKVQLTPGAIAAETQLTFTSNTTGNPLLDAFVGGTHNLFVKGKLNGEGKRGKFELEETRVDGIPIPKVFINSLFEKYVKPKYPEADLKEPFDLPWGIRTIDIQTARVRIVY
jgi:hypothetical protein